MFKFREIAAPRTPLRCVWFKTRNLWRLFQLSLPPPSPSPRACALACAGVGLCLCRGQPQQTHQRGRGDVACVWIITAFLRRRSPPRRAHGITQHNVQTFISTPIHLRTQLSVSSKTSTFVALLRIPYVKWSVCYTLDLFLHLVYFF